MELILKLKMMKVMIYQEMEKQQVIYGLKDHGFVKVI